MYSHMIKQLYNHKDLRKFWIIYILNLQKNKQNLKKFRNFYVKFMIIFNEIKFLNVHILLENL